MAKQQLALVAALLALFVVAASSYRTTIVINEDTAPERGEKQLRRTTEGCQGRFQAQQLSSCKQYLRAAGRKGQQGYIVLPARRKEQGGGGQQGQQEQKRQLQQCCQQLRQVEEKCRCEALKEIVHGEQQQQPAQPSQPGQGQGQVQQRASVLPAACGLGSQRCEFGTGAPGRSQVFW